MFKINKNFIFFFLVLAACLISISFVKYANIYHGELDIYLPHYLGHLSIISKIYSPISELDFTGGIYRGRELGNAFNFLDYVIFAKVVTYGLNFCISFVFYGIVVFTVIYLRKNCIKLGLDEISAILIPILFISMPPVLLGGLLYRSNKIVSAVFLLITIITIFKKLTEDKKSISPLSIFTIIVYAVSASMSDEQGLAFIVLLLIFLVTSLYSRPKNLLSWLKIIFALVVTVILVLIQRLIIGPWIFFKVNGHSPIINAPELLGLNDLHSVIKTLILIIRYVNYVFGNFSGSVFVQGCFLLAIFYILFIRNGKFNPKKIILPFGFSVIWLVFFFEQMLIKHPALLWPDIISYYSLPFSFFIYGCFVGFVSKRLVQGELSEKPFHMVLMTLIILNLFSIPKNIELIVSGHLKNVRVASTLLDLVNKKHDINQELSGIALKEYSPGVADLDIGKAGITALRESKKNAR